MKTDLLADRHIGIQEEDLPVMLEKIGVKSLDELINKTIPSKIRLKEPLPLAAPMTEREFAEHITELASQNKIYTSYIGMGWYDSITPAVIQRNVFENPVWYTSYTPYQTEVSQGRLEALMNFQTVISDLTAMPLANCSLLDESTAAAEAATMMYGLRTRDQQKSGANVLFVDEEIFPQNLAVIQTRALPQDMKIQVGNYKELAFTPEIFACILQYPNASGSVEDYREFVEKAHAAHCKVAVDADIMSLALLVPPGEWGADIVFGSTSAWVSPCSTEVRPQPTSLHVTNINAICRDVSSAGLKTNMANWPTVWLYRPVSNILNAKKQLPTSAPHRHYWLQWPASMPFIMGRKVSKI